MEQYVNNQTDRRKIKMPFRTDSERVVLKICQALCFHFQCGAWKSCDPCPTKRLIKCENGGEINLDKNIVLRLLPAEGKIEVMRGGKLKTWSRISAFSISFDYRICLVRFFNAQKRPILAINQFGCILL